MSAADAPAEGLAICVLEALWSADDLGTGAADGVLGLYRELREQDWGDPDTDGVTELLAQIDAVGGPAQWANLVRTRLLGASTRVEVLRATAVVEACDLLIGADLRDSAALRAADADTVTHLERAWKRMAGHRSGKSFVRLLQLCGAAGGPG